MNGAVDPDATSLAAKCLQLFELVPWWGWAALSLVNVAWGVSGLRSADGTVEVLSALGVLLMVAPAQAVVARRRRRGLPLWRHEG